MFMKVFGNVGLEWENKATDRINVRVVYAGDAQRNIQVLKRRSA
jgi:hypothetical protein